MLRALVIGGLIAVGIAAAPGANAAEFAVSSPAFVNNTPIPAEYSCNGRNVPPPLRWDNVPGGTESLALIVDDPDAVGGLYTHWVVTGIPPSTSGIVDGALPAGAVVSANSGGKAAYLGPCPPAVAPLPLPAVRTEQAIDVGADNTGEASHPVDRRRSPRHGQHGRPFQRLRPATCARSYRTQPRRNS